MPRSTLSRVALPENLRQQLVQLGSDVKLARKRRRISRGDMAERMMVDPRTLDRLEAGDPAVSIGIVLTALWVLGINRRLDELVSPASDIVGLNEERRHLPQRIRSTTSKADDFDF